VTAQRSETHMANRYLMEERGDRDLAPADESAFKAAAELLRQPRPAWPPPRGRFDQLVFTLALTALRLYGAVSIPKAAAFAAVREAARSMARTAA
jgi:hypothetical protein